jgi:hypothetical protein
MRRGNPEHVSPASVLFGMLSRRSTSVTARAFADDVSRFYQQTTHEWWNTRRRSYELCASQLVLGEAAAVTPKPLEKGLKS